VKRMLLSAVLLAMAPMAQAQERHTYANPIDIDYRYNFEQMNEGISYRTGADPVVVLREAKIRRSRARESRAQNRHVPG